MRASATLAREERLELRLRPEDKASLEAAARQQGVSVSAYLLAHSLPAARREAANAVLLDDPARDALLALLARPPRLNAAMSKALGRARALRA